MKNYIWTFIGLVLALLLLSTDLLLNLDLFESFAGTLENLEAYEIDEFVLPSFLLLIFSLIDFVRFKKEQKSVREKTQIYKAMVQASDHVLKNCLNQMLLIKYEAEEMEGFDPKVIALFDKSMKEAMEQLDALGRIREVDREKIGDSIDIELFD